MQRHAFFVKRLQGGSPLMAPFHVYLKVDPILRTVAKKHAFPTLVTTSGHSDHLRPIQLERLEFELRVLHSLPVIFSKNHFSFACRHFIKESTTDWHDSNPSHGRPPRRNRPVFENTVKNSKKSKKWETSASHHQMWPTN